MKLTRTETRCLNALRAGLLDLEQSRSNFPTALSQKKWDPFFLYANLLVQILDLLRRHRP